MIIDFYDPRSKINAARIKWYKKENIFGSKEWLLIRGSLTGFRVSLSIGGASILD